MKDDAPFAFAGLWDAWKASDGSWLQSFSIITTDANELAARVYSRMPLILHPKHYDRWLERDSERAPVDLLRPLKQRRWLPPLAIRKWAMPRTTAQRC